MPQLQLIELQIEKEIHLGNDLKQYKNVTFFWLKSCQILLIILQLVQTLINMTHT